ncbi:DNA-binding domain-containing protein [Niveibacterium umoris]|uniref:Putative DNA-binding domain-containing protein n=1 Tax=Niveibacterium umoris TaxID=1193620 RepID=A0A840BJC2_9RHOO|nr:DNA-binding domain-containing protein [Niveibacterium umoris]MBB4011679.1 hypothetical protein [Niveibacterium umoris]
MNSVDAFAAGLRDISHPAPADLRCWHGGSTARRFAVYRNNRAASLIAGLEDAFPVTRELVGQDCFRALASGFIEAHPPRSPALFEYGDALPDFIGDIDALKPYPYLSDVARLERLRVVAWHAADAQALKPADFAACLADVETLPVLKFRMLPSFALLESDWAVYAIWASHQGDDPMTGVQVDRPETVAVVRPYDDIHLHLFDAGTAALIGALAAGETLGASIALASTTDPEFELGTALTRLIACQCVAAITS